MTRLRFLPDRSRATVAGDAPGHRFQADGPGIAGLVVLEGTRLVQLEATFPLDRLDAHDLLKNRELRRFLALDQRPIARVELEGEAHLTQEGPERFVGDVPLAFSIGPRRMRTVARLAATLPHGTARFTLTFSGLGLEPPKLLFMKMKDALDIEATAELTTES